MHFLIEPEPCFAEAQVLFHVSACRSSTECERTGRIMFALVGNLLVLEHLLIYVIGLNYFVNNEFIVIPYVIQCLRIIIQISSSI